MSEEDFWRLTPVQFFALVKQSNEGIKRNDLRFGYLLSLIHNMFAKKSKKPEYWFPSLKSSVRKVSPEEDALRQRLAQAHLRRGLRDYGEAQCRNSSNRCQAS